MDGSAAPFVAAIDQAGLVVRRPRRAAIMQGAQAGPRRPSATPSAKLRPYAHGFRLDVEIQFDHPAIGRQTFSRDLSADSFRHDLARARTFGFMRDVAKL